MDSVSSSTVQRASSADLGSVSGQAAVSVLKKALHQQGAAAMKLLDSVAQPLPQAQLAESGALGTRLNTYA